MLCILRFANIADDAKCALTSAGVSAATVIKIAEEGVHGRKSTVPSFRY